MKALRFLRALSLVSLIATPALASQGTIVGPTSGPKTMAEVMTTLNAAMLAIQSCNSGTSAPANGPGAVAVAHQCWADTSAGAVVSYKKYDGTTWVTFGKLNTSTHVWTPVYQGTDTGTASTAATGTSGHTLGFLDGANTWSAIQSFNSAMLSLKGSTSGAGTLNAPPIASTYVWTLPAATDTLVGKATTDTLTNKTFDTAATGNSFSINGLAATANTGTGSVVRATSPTLVTPTLGVAAATSINKVAITAPATGATLTIPDGVTLTGPAASGTAMTFGNAETVTGTKSFNDATVILKGATSGTTAVKAAAIAGTTTMTLPAATDTLVGKATADTLTNKTFDTAGAGNSFSINGLAATANTGTGAVVRATSPAITTPTGIVKGDVGLGNVDNTSDTTKWAATKTFTNTTFNCGSTGNVCTVRLASDITGFGTGVATALGVNIGSAGAPVLFNGALGTPSSGVATNLTGTASGLTAGNVTTNANLTGDVTSVGNATTLPTVNSNVGSFGGASAVSNFTVNAKGLITAAGSAVYQDGTNAAKGVVRGDGTTISCVAGVCTSVGSAATSIAVGTTTTTGGSSGDDLYINAGVLGSRTRSNPTQQIFLSGSGTYTKPANVSWIRVRMIGAGGGGAGSGTGGGGTGGAGGTTTFGSSTLTALGGGGGLANAAGGTGGAKTTLAGSPLPVGITLDGGDGGASGGLPSATNNTAVGGNGCSSPFGGSGSGGGGTGPAVPTAGKANTGSGGGGAASGTTGLFPGAGGACGAFIDATISGPNSTYAYAVGAAGTAGAAGTSGTVGAAGGSGYIIVEEHYGP